MTTTDTSLFKLASLRMEWATARQKAISENIANADTPGYVGKDVQSFEDFLQKAESGAGGGVETTEATNAWSGSFDGNRVVLEEQTLLSTSNAGDFALATKLYRKGHALVALAAGRK
jgi:flagellar basal-body rod protein FlgB